MKTKLCVLPGIILVLAFIACSSPAGGGDPSYTVSGTISLSDGGSPSGAQVQLRQNASAIGNAVADAAGNYTINGVPAGTYTISVSHGGYETWTEDVTVGNTAISKNLTLTKTPPNTYSIGGTIGVSDSGTGGSPNGASVQLKKDGETAGSAVYAAGNGAYTISGVFAGTYTIEVSLDGYDTGTIADVEVSGAGLTGQDITLTKTVYTVSGTISVSDGSPEGASVQLLDGDGSVVNSTTAASGGTYTISGVPAGTYTIEVSFDGYDTGTITDVEVSGANLTDQNITLTKTVVAVTGVSLNQDTLSLTVGETATLIATVAPSNATNQTVTWSSDNTGVATVSGGEVIAVAAGSAIITVTADGDKTASCKVNSYTATYTGTITSALDQVKASEVTNGNFLIKLGQNESSVSVYDLAGFPTPVTITIDGAKDGGEPYSVGWAVTTASGKGSVTIQDGVTLILRNVTFTGSTANYSAGSLVRVASGGVFKMQDGATLTEHLASYGGAVYVENGGDFNMTGGSITGNKSANYGHGVYVASGGSMTMTGGSITGNTHRTNANGPNDVTIFASTSAAGSLAMSGDARIGNLYLYYYNATYFGTITINDGFTGSGAVAIIDLRNTDFNGKQILSGTAVSSSYDRFTRGVYRSSFGSGSGNGIAPDYYIDSSGYLRKK